MRIRRTVAGLCLSVLLSPQGRAQAPSPGHPLYEIYVSSDAPPHYKRLIESEVRREKREQRVLDAQQKEDSSSTGTPSSQGALSAQASLSATADPAFVLRDIYAYPNPARGSERPTFHIEVGIADKVEIRIYNLAGELVEAQEITSPPKVINGVYAYEYRWEAHGAASGVYLYLVRAFKQGRPTIKALKKSALIK